MSLIEKNNYFASERQAMELVIDAYNVLKQHMSDDYINENTRSHFINQLRSYAKNKGHKVVVVFDGGPYDRPAKFHEKGIYVVYSGVQESADDWIKRYLNERKNSDIVLISTDRALCSSVKRFGIESLDSGYFWRILKEMAGRSSADTLVSDSQIVKTTEQQVPGLDELMIEGSKTVQKKVVDIKPEQRDRKPKAHTVPKEQRKRLKKIKKL